MNRVSIWNASVFRRWHYACIRLLMGVSVRILAVLVVVLSAAADDPAPRSYTEIPAIAQGQAVIWHDPGAIEQLDFRYGIGGEALAPKPPFSFVKENMTGTSP